MGWFSTLKVASQEFEKDVEITKEFFSLLEKKIHCENGYRFSEKAEFAAGWWFYKIYLKDDMIKKLIEFERAHNPKFDESSLADLLQRFLKQHRSKAKISAHTGRSIFQKYWSWLLK